MGENSDDEESLYFRTIDIVEQDNKHEFVGLINRVDSDDIETIILEIYFRDAANCLAAILDGEAGDESLITVYHSQVVKNMPLHFAAIRAKPRITSLLLDKGFSADLRTDIDCPPFCLRNALPLNVSLDHFRAEAKWIRLCLSLSFKIWEFYKVWEVEPWKSPIHQVIKFCRQASYNASTRVIARKTTEIKHEFFKYLKQGKVFEVGALLAIASDLLMSPSSTIDGENGSIGFKNIMEMRQFLLAEMSRSLGASDTQLREMKKTVRLLEIFDRIGDKLIPHMPMWDKNVNDAGIKVASLIEDAAYDEKAEVEYELDAVPSAYYPPYRFLSRETTPPTVVKSTTLNHSGGQYPNCTTSPNVFKRPTVCFIDEQHPNCTRKSSTKVHFPSWLKEGRFHVDAPLPFPTTLKSAVTKHVLPKKHASFTGAFTKAVRHLRYC